MSASPPFWTMRGHRRVKANCEFAEGTYDGLTWAGVLDQLQAGLIPLALVAASSPGTWRLPCLEVARNVAEHGFRRPAWWTPRPAATGPRRRRPDAPWPPPVTVALRRQETLALTALILRGFPGWSGQLRPAWSRREVAEPVRERAFPGPDLKARRAATPAGWGRRPPLPTESRKFAPRRPRPGPRSHGGRS